MVGCGEEPVFEKACSALLGSSHISVDVVEDPVVIDTSMTRAQISQQLIAAGKPMGPRDALGLTAASLSQEYSLKFSYVKGLAGVCAVPQGNIVLRLHKPVIQIASEFPEGSCMYEHVLRHEQEHLAIYRRFQATGKALLEDLLTRELSAETVFSFNDLAEMEEYQHEVQNKWLAPAIEQVMSGVAEEHQKLDTPQEYQRIGALLRQCERQN